MEKRTLDFLSLLGRSEDNEREYIAHFAWIAAVVLSAMFVGDQRLWYV